MILRMLLFTVLLGKALWASAESAIHDLDDERFPSLVSAKAVYDLSKKERHRVTRLLTERPTESRFPFTDFIMFPEHRKRFWCMPSGMRYELIYEGWPEFYLASCRKMVDRHDGSMYRVLIQRFTNVDGRLACECVERRLTVRGVSYIDRLHALRLAEDEWDYLQSTVHLKIPEGFFSQAVSMGLLQFRNIVSGSRFHVEGRSFSAIAYSGRMAEGEVQLRSIVPNCYGVLSRRSRADSWGFVGVIAFAATPPSKMDAPLEPLLRISIPVA